MRMKKNLIAIMLFIFPLVIKAQWKVGVGVSPSLNNYDYPQQFWIYDSFSWGMSAGIFGHYDINDYFGVRAEINWTQKNHFQYWSVYSSDTGYKTVNNYIQLPIIATGCLHWGNLKPFINLGVYGAYWISSHEKSEMGLKDLTDINDYYNRFEFGLLGGIGLEYPISKHLALQIEGRCYYGATSSKKEINGISNTRYNTTFVLQPSICYLF